MDTLDEVFTIDGVQYTQRELNVLREYCSRETKGASSKKSLAAFLKLGAGNENVNSFLATGCLPDYVSNVEELKTFLSKIEILYNIACKYGKSHEFPNTPLYREEQYYHNIVGNDDYRCNRPRRREWVAEAFKSFSKSRGESDAFSLGEFRSHKLVLNYSGEEKNRLPFIDVNKLLDTNHVLSGESEIIIPPYQMFLVDKETSIVTKAPQLPYNSPINDFNITITNEMRNPYSVKKQKSDGKDISPYNASENDVSDAELELIAELNKKQFSSTSPLTDKEQETLKKLQNKLRIFIMKRCKSIYKMQMETPLVVGNYASKDALFEYGYHVPEKPKDNYIYTLEDWIKSNANSDPFLWNIFGSGRASDDVMTKYTLTDFSNGVPVEIVENVLSSGHRTGNRKVIRELASQGLTIDEVLAYNGQITPCGLAHLEYLSSTHLHSKTPVLLETERKKFGNSGLDNLFIFSDLYSLEKMVFTVLQDDSTRTPSQVALDSLASNGQTARYSDVTNTYGDFVNSLTQSSNLFKGD